MIERLSVADNPFTRESESTDDAELPPKTVSIVSTQRIVHSSQEFIHAIVSGNTEWRLILHDNTIKPTGVFPQKHTTIHAIHEIIRVDKIWHYGKPLTLMQVRARIIPMNGT